MAVIEPLFILAPPGNLTSVVCAMLGCHPQLAALPETNLFVAATSADLERAYAERPHLRDGLLRAIAEYGMGGQTEEHIGAARAWLQENRAASPGDVFRQLMAWTLPRGVVEKSPGYAHTRGAFERIRKAFPQARYLHLARHPRAACESLYKTRPRLPVGTGHPAAREWTPEYMWLKPHLRILEFLEGVSADRTMFLRGEALLSQPALYLPQIAEWIGVSTDQPAIEAMLHPECSPFARFGPPSAPMGNDRGFMESPKLRRPQRYPDNLDGPVSGHFPRQFDETLKVYATHFGYWGPPSVKKPLPLIVLCPMLSSSAAVTAMLGRHPEMYGLPQVNLFIADTVSELLRIHERRPQDMHGLLGVLAELRDGVQTEPAVEAARRWLEARQRWTTKQVFDYLLDRAGGRIPVDGSSRTVLRPEYLRRLLAMYPQARCLHLTHHPYSTAKALLANLSRRSPSGGTLPRRPIDPEEFWLKAHQNIVDFSAGLRLGQYMQIRSEDLLVDPQVYLPQITEWLGVSTAAAAIEAMLRPRSSPDASPGTANTSLGSPPLRPAQVKEPSLHQELEWERGRVFSKPTVKLAKMLGYA